MALKAVDYNTSALLANMSNEIVALKIDSTPLPPIQWLPYKDLLRIIVTNQISGFNWCGQFSFRDKFKHVYFVTSARTTGQEKEAEQLAVSKQFFHRWRGGGRRRDATSQKETKHDEKSRKVGTFDASEKVTQTSQKEGEDQGEK